MPSVFTMTRLALKTGAATGAVTAGLALALALALGLGAAFLTGAFLALVAAFFGAAALDVLVFLVAMSPPVT